MKVTHIEKQLLNFSKQQKEPLWLTTKRMLAWSQFKAQCKNDQLPSLAECWGDQLSATTKMHRLAKPTPDLTNLVQLDLQAALQIYPELLQENLMEKALSWQSSSLAALHLALLAQGQFIYIPANTRIEQPVMIKTTSNPSNYHVLIIVEAGAQAELVEQINISGQARSYLGTEILLGSGAQVNYYQVDHVNSKQHYQTIHAYQAQDASLQTYLTLFNPGKQDYDVHVDLDGDRSQANVKMVAIADQHQNQVITTRINNYGRHTVGFIEQNGVAKDASNLEFHAIGKIFHGAHGGKSNQRSRLLTLSTQSHGQVDPVLLIEENDVVAGHAASIGKIDEDQLYYLQTRGISRQQSYYLLTKGFLLPVLNKIPNVTLKNKTIAQLQQRLQ